jgi:hypothetical protein
MKFTFSIFLACTVSALSAQHAIITDHDRGTFPVVPDSVKQLDLHSVILRREIILDRVFEGENVVEYQLVQLTTWIKDGVGVDQNNKVSLNLNNVNELVSVKARSRNPDGTITELAPDAFKRMQDEDHEQEKLYFAYEGLVPGSIVDQLHVIKRNANLRGSRVLLQFEEPVLEEELHLTGPARLVNMAKGYNGAPEATRDTSVADMEHLRWTIRNVSALKSEPASAPNAECMQVIYALDRVPDQNLKDWSGYLSATKIYHDQLYPVLSAKTNKALKKIIQDAQVEKVKDQEGRIRALEQYVKENFSVRPMGPGSRDLDQIIKERNGDHIGLDMLYCTLLTQLGIEHQVVMTSDRTEVRFDPDQGNFFFLQDVLLYFPQVDKYLAPTDFSLRLGWVPGNNTDNNALFIRSYDLGGTSTGVGKVQWIAALPDSLNSHDITATVKLNADASAADVELENRLSGYFASGLQSYYAFLNEEERTKLHEGLLGYLTNNSTSSSVTVENGDGRSQGVKPLVLHAKLSTAKFSGTAGEKRLFNIGELIGPQSEMYATEKRTLPISEEFCRRFRRDLTVVIPDGWTLLNGTDLAMDKHFDLDGERILNFISTWHMEGNTLMVHIDENYRRCQLPVAQAEAYRETVNAAADWNKLKLVLVKN